MTYLILLGCLIGIVVTSAITILINALNGRYDRIESQPKANVISMDSDKKKQEDNSPSSMDQAA